MRACSSLVAAAAVGSPALSCRSASSSHDESFSGSSSTARWAALTASAVFPAALIRPATPSAAPAAASPQPGPFAVRQDPFGRADLGQELTGIQVERPGPVLGGVRRIALGDSSLGVLEVGLELGDVEVASGQLETIGVALAAYRLVTQTGRSQALPDVRGR